MTAGEGMRSWHLTIYSRPGCHLCDEMKAVVVLALENSPIQVTLEEVDVSTDPALEARYGHEVPVLTIDGRKAAKYRVTESEMTRMLEGPDQGEGRDQPEEWERREGHRGGG